MDGSSATTSIDGCRFSSSSEISIGEFSTGGPIRDRKKRKNR